MCLGVVVVIGLLFEIDQIVLYHVSDWSITEYPIKTRFADGFEQFLAVAIGALVARRGFAIPAISLTVFWWVVSTVISYRITPHDMPSWSYLDTFLGWLPSLPLIVAISWIGALVGCRYSKYLRES